VEKVLKLLAEYERRGSAEMRAVLQAIRRQLESPTGRKKLGIIMDGRFVGID
jgi:hypothetical protein